MLPDRHNLAECARWPIAEKSVDALKSINSTTLSNFVEWALARNETLACLATTGAIHPLGFMKLLLWNGPSCERIRLHLWPVSVKLAPANNPHDHYWPFSSVVVSGAIESTAYEVTTSSASGPEFHEWKLQQFHSSPIRGAPYRFIDGGNVQLVARKKSVFQTGDVYSMHTGQIHSVMPRGPLPAATLVLQGPAESQVTRTFHSISAYHRSQPTAREIVLTPELVRTALSDYVI